MSTVNERILDCIRLRPHMSEVEIARAVFGPSGYQQQVNTRLRALAAKGLVVRDRKDGVYTYTAVDGAEPAPRPAGPPADNQAMSEDGIKVVLQKWLTSQGYRVQVAMGNERGVDIEALRGDERRLIEVKGPGSRPEMRVNYFISILGEMLQRMSDPRARYSVAFPDMAQFRRLWERLPGLAKERTGITALFVSDEGKVEEAG